MAQIDILRDVISRLEKTGFPYVITGSIAGSYYGKPRLTHDIDIVILLTHEDIAKVVEAFSGDYYIDSDMISEAINDNSTFNIIHNAEGLKIDFWLRKNRTFDIEMFGRRRKLEAVEGLKAFLPSPEDIILLKLLWFKETDSGKQFQDALGIYTVQKKNLDSDYIRHWGRALELTSELEDLENSSAP